MIKTAAVCVRSRRQTSKGDPRTPRSHTANDSRARLQRVVHLDTGTRRQPKGRRRPLSVTLDTEDLDKSISGDPATLHFQTGDAKLKPLFEFCDGFHSEHLDIQPQSRRPGP